MDSTLAQYGVMNRNHPRGEGGEVFAVITLGEEPLQVRPDVAINCLPSGTQRVRVGDVNDDRSSICHVL
jgi:hypothetical protein